MLSCSSSMVLVFEFKKQAQHLFLFTPYVENRNRKLMSSVFNFKSDLGKKKQKPAEMGQTTALLNRNVEENSRDY